MSASITKEMILFERDWQLDNYVCYRRGEVIMHALNYFSLKIIFQSISYFYKKALY